ncbi:MAG: hypothetical protein AAF623_12230 [Planctomycetota bacterium]
MDGKQTDNPFSSPSVNSPINRSNKKDRIAVIYWSIAAFGYSIALYLLFLANQLSPELKGFRADEVGETFISASKRYIQYSNWATIIGFLSFGILLLGNRRNRKNKNRTGKKTNEDKQKKVP